jgi:hypothetical protein
MNSREKAEPQTLVAYHINPFFLSGHIGDQFKGFLESLKKSWADEEPLSEQDMKNAQMRAFMDPTGSTLP